MSTTPEAKRASMQKWRDKNPGAVAEQRKRYHLRLKLAAIEAYGGKCCVCGEARPDVMEFHHREGGGNKQREEVFGYGHQSPGGWMFYLWLKKQGYPQDLGIELRCQTCHDLVHPNRKKKDNGAYGASPGMDRQDVPLYSDVVPF